MSDYSTTLEKMRSEKTPHRCIPDLGGNPFFIVEKRVPDKCPPGEAETYYRWGIKFSADGNFLYKWGNAETT